MTIWSGLEAGAMGGLAGRPQQSVPKIVTSRLAGGLGNQLFQYAVARGIAARAEAEIVLLHDQNFSGIYGRAIGISNFNIAASIHGEGTPHPRYGDIFSGDSHSPSSAVIREPLIFEPSTRADHQMMTDPENILFQRDILTCDQSVNLIGFWQDERYFTDIQEVIRRDFTLRDRLDDRSQAVLTRIKADASVFIHVRRGDYLSDQFADRFGFCGARYYHYALEVVRARHPGRLNVFVFSDDSAWVRENAIGGQDAQIVDWNGSSPAHDLMLMRACRHGIISNSSFSWWGAWLGERPNRTVIAPLVWFKAVPEFKEIVPERWLRV